MKNENEKHYSPAEMAKYIDHTLLKADATTQQVKQICAEAREQHFASVCVNPCHTRLVAEELAGSDVLVCAVISFPLGAEPAAHKAAAAQRAREDGAQEIDMVINIGAAKEGHWALVEEDIKAVVQAAAPAAVKVIIETCLLNDEEKRQACEAAKRAGAAFVKTSTGFSTAGATVEDVALMRKTVGEQMGVKASGGIRSYADAVRMLEAGASRIGASAGLKIVRGE